MMELRGLVGGGGGDCARAWAETSDCELFGQVADGAGAGEGKASGIVKFGKMILFLVVLCVLETGVIVWEK